MTTALQQIRARRLAAKGKGPAPAVAAASTDGAAPYREQLQWLDNALAEIRSVDDIEERNRRAAPFIPQAIQWCKNYRDSGRSYPHKLLPQLIVWLVNAREWRMAIDWAVFAVGQQLHQLPENFKRRRKIDEFIIDAVKDWAHVEVQAGRDAAPHLQQVADLVVSKQWSAHPMALSQLLKTAGLSVEEADPAKAVQYYQAALDVNPKAGCKTHLERAQIKVKRSPLAGAVGNTAQQVADSDAAPEPSAPAPDKKARG